MTCSCNNIYDVHVKVPPSVSCVHCMWLFDLLLAVTGCLYWLPSGWSGNGWRLLLLGRQFPK